MTTTVKLDPRANSFLVDDLFAHSDELGWDVEKIKDKDGNVNELNVKLPSGWTVREFSKGIQRAFDSLGNPRAAFYQGCGIQFYTRFQLLQKNCYNQDTGLFGDRLYLFDTMTEKTIIDFGFIDNGIELYSDIHTDLLHVAKASISKVFPKWDKPSAYWDLDLDSKEAKSDLA